MPAIDATLGEDFAPAVQQRQLTELGAELLETAQELRRAARGRMDPADLAGMLGGLEAGLDALACCAAEFRVAALAEMAGGRDARYGDLLAVDVGRHLTDLQRALADSATSSGALRSTVDAHAVRPSN